MKVERLLVLPAALAVFLAPGTLRATGLIVTISPNPVEAKATATIMAVPGPNVPVCFITDFDFGDGETARVAYDSSHRFVTQHAWASAGKYLVKAASEPVATCPAVAGGAAEATVTTPLVRAPSGKPEGSAVSAPLSSTGLGTKPQPAEGSVRHGSLSARQHATATPTPVVSGWGLPKGPPPGGGSPPSPNPIHIEFVPPKPAPNSLVAVKLSGLATCSQVSIDYGDGKSEGASLPPSSWGQPTMFYHSFAKPGTYKLTAWASQGQSSVGACFAVGPGSAQITVE